MAAKLDHVATYRCDGVDCAATEELKLVPRYKHTYGSEKTMPTEHEVVPAGWSYWVKIDTLRGGFNANDSIHWALLCPEHQPDVTWNSPDDE